ncbi:riboflavin synthase subunit alpha [Aurantiacibacter atlanticus]|uniref:Riboflavin synthase n=1 Tax=Aurantiacibacter atlanticus TaxID=1648404 RepID=A0A0H4VEM5_9SPHN|nr:riboflavin synthase [Aurantiacibacter atlanticus]AKQ42815.1 riboflavin synthase subunit alpha [Aurantiacibacter atlanticus]MDF1835952.1 riboflavin synthase [Alteraurantiacibacter sp. bin_em_oilr2.035]
MFTGIVTAIGTIANAQQHGDLRLRIECPFDPAEIAIGASIACSGVCLTVVDRGGTAGDAHFTVDVSSETVSRTATGMWEEGARLNLEPSLRVGDEIGGHIVTGHVDRVGKVVDWQPVGGSMEVVISAPAPLAPYIAEKGSITVDGVSLTVNSIEDKPDGTVLFTLNIIPHTEEVTTLGELRQGGQVNLEIDTLARYLHRMQMLKTD